MEFDHDIESCALCSAIGRDLHEARNEAAKSHYQIGVRNQALELVRSWLGAG